MFGIDGLLAVLGLVIPPTFDFIKKKFIKSGDTPEATINSLALTKPEYIGEYINGMSALLSAQTAWFNRDVSGELPKWVAGLRAAIRPVGVICCILALCASQTGWLNLDPATRGTFGMVVTAWFSDRMMMRNS